MYLSTANEFLVLKNTIFASLNLCQGTAPLDARNAIFLNSQNQCF